MRYILLIYQNPVAFRSLDDSERLALMDQAGSIMNELMAAGEWVSGEGLADPSTAKTARVRDGIPAVTDGPFAEAKEHVVGYAIIDCESQERAIEYRAALARFAAVGGGGARYFEPKRSGDVGRWL